MIDNERIAAFFKESGYSWQFSDGLRIPDADEINKTIQAAVEALAGAEENTQVEIGRLMIKKRAGVHDVFVLFATEEN